MPQIRQFIVTALYRFMYIIRWRHSKFQPIDTITTIDCVIVNGIGIFIAIPKMIYSLISFRCTIFIFRHTCIWFWICPIPFPLRDTCFLCHRSFASNKHFTTPMNGIILTKRTRLYFVKERIDMQFQDPHAITTSFLAFCTCFSLKRVNIIKIAGFVKRDFINVRSILFVKKPLGI